jgi:hypothetical protein
VAWAAVAVLVASCTTTRSSAPAGASSAVVTQTEPVRAWRLTEADTTLGWVVEFADASAPDATARRFFSLRNSLHQELGSMDAFGRTWRFVPHQRDPAWLGTGTMIEGARKVLGGGDRSKLAEVAIAELKRESAPQD